MRTFLHVLFFYIIFTLPLSVVGQTVIIKWETSPEAGAITVTNGKISQIKSTNGRANLKGNTFKFAKGDRAELAIAVDQANNSIGAEATVVHIQSKIGSFSFFLRDVQSINPIYVPLYQAVVLPEKDTRTYKEVENAVISRKRLTKVQTIDAQAEASFESVAAKTRNMSVPIWLGISRDIRLFEVEDELEDNHLETREIRPRLAATPLRLPETEDKDLHYRYALGRGVGIKDNITKSLEEGVMPIYHSKMQDDDILYHSITFTALEKSALIEENVEGTDYVISDKYSPGRVFTAEQQDVLEKKLANTPANTEEVVLYSRTTLENLGSVPRYGWIKAPQPKNGSIQYAYDKESGFSSFDTGRVFCISKVNGKPIPHEEVAILLQPNEKATFEFYLPHSPISAKRAEDLAQTSFEQKYVESKAFWNSKLAKAAKITVPEKRIQEMIQAGLLHLDLITYGKQPNGTLAANVGIYSPIGTESSAIIQFYASMGWTHEAKRAIQYFLDTQQESGLIANYSGYMIETGAVLWNIGEYYRYTQDNDWLAEITPKVLKSCDYLIDWRNKNKLASLKGKGYGMIDGKVADPEDNYHQFMLNAYAYLGLSRMAEILNKVNDPKASFYKEEAEAWKQDIRTSFFNSLANAPLIPLGDGTWSPTAPPWPEAEGPRLLFQKAEKFWSHGTFTVADALLGPMHLVFSEVLDPEEKESKILFNYNSELMFQENSAFSQPYYSRHNWYQSRMGMVKPFLNTYYSTMAATTDHQTYSFWEHLYKMTPHKTHEEANFLMETRRMLYEEIDDTLTLFAVIPRKWMEQDKKIALENVQSYFGPLTVQVLSNVDKGYIEAIVDCDSQQKPATVNIRLPHPDHQKPIQVTGGDYNEQTETITIKEFNGHVKVRLTYPIHLK